MPVHPNCQGANNCHAAFVATRGLGLFYTDTLVFDTDTHPEWEHLGQIIQIYQFSYDYKNPANAQVALDYYDRVYIRRPGLTGDNWIEILNKTTCQNALAAFGFTDQAGLDIDITWVEYMPNNMVFALFRAGDLVDENAAWFFIKSLDAGNTWYIPDTYLYKRFPRVSGQGSFRISYTSSELYKPGQIMFLALHNQFGDRSGFLYSRDVGESWWPRDTVTNLPKPYWGPYTTNMQIPIPSIVYQDAIYYGDPSLAPGPGKYAVARRDAWLTGPTVDKSAGGNSNAWLNSDQYAVWLNPYTGFTMVTASLSHMWWTTSLESIGGPIWNSRPDAAVNAIGGTITNDLLYGYWNPQTVNNKYETVRSTGDLFANIYGKSGANSNLRYTDHGDAVFDSLCIPRDCQGVSRMGIVVWDVPDPIVDDEPPTPASGYPIWINCKAYELRDDPSWDRLYVMAKTVWPNGSGLWNQPLMFEYFLSGYWGATYLENTGVLGFVPTFSLGQGSMYSGAISYNGHTEAHLKAPDITPEHGVIIVGRFDDNNQVMYKADNNNPPGLSGWNQVAQFGNGIRATSVESDFEIEGDLTVTTTEPELYIPSGISTSGIWPWLNPKNTPFTVNCQMREGSDIWIGVEGTNANPIYYGNVLTSGELLLGSWSWEARSNGLPALQINDIERGE